MCSNRSPFRLLRSQVEMLLSVSSNANSKAWEIQRLVVAGRKTEKYLCLRGGGSPATGDSQTVLPPLKQSINCNSWWEMGASGQNQSAWWSQVTTSKMARWPSRTWLVLVSYSHIFKGGNQVHGRTDISLLSTNHQKGALIRKRPAGSQQLDKAFQVWDSTYTGLKGANQIALSTSLLLSS